MCTEGLLGPFVEASKNWANWANNTIRKRNLGWSIVPKNYLNNLTHPLMVLHFGTDDSNKNTDSTRGESHHMAKDPKYRVFNHPFLGGQSEKTSQSSKFKHNQTKTNTNINWKFRNRKHLQNLPKPQKNEENSSLTAPPCVSALVSRRVIQSLTFHSHYLEKSTGWQLNVVL